MATMSCAGCGREQAVALDKNERCGFCRELDASCEAATERERGAVVAWLRGRAEALQRESRRCEGRAAATVFASSAAEILTLIRAIERGEHRRAK